MHALPLDQLLVLDLTRHRAGPVASRLFADGGARVIKIESPSDAGDSMGGAREGFDYQNLHRHKQSLALDLKHPQGRRVFHALARQADVVLESFRPAVKHRLGADYETPQALNPRIICGSISGFGQDGPYGDRPAVDQVVQGMSGLMSVTGLPGQGPLRAGAAIADVGAGMVLSQGLLMALYQRERTGVGQWVHTSLLESLVAILDFQVARWLGTGDVPTQAGNDHPTLMPTGVFPTADGQVTLAAAEEPRFKALCEILALPHLLADPRFRSVPLRGRHREALSAELAGRTRRFASEELIALLNAAGIPCGPIYTIDQAMNDPQMQHLRMSGRVTHPRLGSLSLLGQPLHFEGCGGRPPLRAAAPEHGQHTDEILSELLGYGRSDIEALRAQGAVA